MKDMTIRQIGYMCRGEALLNLWDGSQGTIEMKPWKCNTDKQGDIAKGLNDNGMGCESFKSAEIYVYELYEHGVVLPLEEITLNKEECANAQRGV